MDEVEAGMAHWKRLLHAAYMRTVKIYPMSMFGELFLF